MIILLLSIHSKFVPRNSVKIFDAVLVSNSSLESTAFLTPDKRVVVVVMNTGDQPITFKLLDHTTGGRAGTNRSAVRVTALAHSIQTFLYY